MQSCRNHKTQKEKKNQLKKRNVDNLKIKETMQLFMYEIGETA